MARMNRRFKAALLGVLIVVVACVILFVPFIPEAIGAPVQQVGYPRFIFHYYGSIGYVLFGLGVTYWRGEFYWGPPPPYFYA